VSTLEDAASKMQSVLDALDEARTGLSAVADELDTAVGQLDAAGVTDRAEAAGSIKDDVDPLAGAVGGLHDTAEVPRADQGRAGDRRGGAGIGYRLAPGYRHVEGRGHRQPRGRCRQVQPEGHEPAEANRCPCRIPRPGN